jgi:hypothetical protein
MGRVCGRGAQGVCSVAGGERRRRHVTRLGTAPAVSCSRVLAGASATCGAHLVLTCGRLLGCSCCLRSCSNWWRWWCAAAVCHAGCCCWTWRVHARAQGMLVAAGCRCRPRGNCAAAGCRLVVCRVCCVRRLPARAQGVCCAITAAALQTGCWWCSVCVQGFFTAGHVPGGTQGVGACPRFSSQCARMRPHPPCHSLCVSCPSCSRAAAPVCAGSVWRWQAAGCVPSLLLSVLQATQGRYCCRGPELVSVAAA